MPVAHCLSTLSKARACRVLGLTLSFLFAAPLFAQAAQELNACPNTAANLLYWQNIYQNRSDSSEASDELAINLLPCLGSPNPTLRDTYGYGLYTHWLRNSQLSTDTKRKLFTELLDKLDSDAVLLRSFSALILSEILRADAIDSFLSEDERDSLLRRSSTALIAESDFRGLDPELGWIHPVAHLADVQWRFALHPQLTPEQARKILQTIASKAVTGQTSYVFNESDRLARVIAIVIRTEILGADEMSGWLEQFAHRANGEDWGSAFGTPAGMIELHNTKSFIRALDSQLVDSDIPDRVHNSLASLDHIFTALI